jgi:hypothetical protein
MYLTYRVVTAKTSRKFEKGKESSCSWILEKGRRMIDNGFQEVGRVQII